jgi:hypothetical protein
MIHPVFKRQTEVDMASKSSFLIVSSLLLAFWLPPAAGLQAQRKEKPKLLKAPLGQPVPRALADLSVRVESINGLEVYPGLAIDNNVRIFLTNSGSMDIRNFDVDILLAKNRFFSPGKIQPLCRQRVDFIKANSTVQFKFAKPCLFPEDCPYGNFFLGALVDSGNTVPEANENNNWGSLELHWAITISDVREIEMHVGKYRKPPLVEVNGNGFGTALGNKQVYVDSTSVSTFSYWGINGFEAALPDGVASGQNHVMTIRRGSVILATSPAFFLYRIIKTLDPIVASAGAVVRIGGWGFGSSQGSLVLMLGSHAVQTITEWNDGGITFTVPAGLAPNSYQLKIMNNGVNESAYDSDCAFDGAFTVQ